MSKKDKNTKDIKKLLQQKLASNEPADDGWNVPSNKVWGELSDDLNASGKVTKRLDRQYLLAAIIVGLVSMLLFRECSHRSDKLELRHEMNQLEQSYDRLQEDCEKSNPTSNSTSQDNTDGNTNVENVDQHGVFASNEQTELPSNEFKPLNKKPSFLSDKYTQEKPEAVSYSSSLVSKKQEDNLHVPQENQFDTFYKKSPDLSQLDILFLNGLKHPYTDPFIQLNLSKIDVVKPFVSFKTNLFAGIALTGNQLTGDIPDIIAGQKALPSYRSGVGLEMVLNPRWSIQTGVQYSATRTQTEYNLEVPYTQFNEFQHDDGNFDNHYNHSLPSTMGNYPALLTLTRPSDAMLEEEEIMPLDLTIEQQVNLISIPLQVRYGFGQSLFRFGVKGGLVANRTSSISSKATSLVSHHGGIHQRHTSIGDPIFENLEKTTFDYSIGLDVRYFFAPRLHGFMETSYQRGIKPIYEENDFRNYLQSGNLMMGIGYSF